jgi:CHRD domain
MSRLWVYAAAAAVVAALAGGSLALASGKHHGGGGSFSARLNGYNEVTGPPNGGSISTVGLGKFKAKLDKNSNTITYTLTYTLENAATALFSHIHFAQQHVNGGIVVFLCGGGGKPACPAGTGSPVTVTGTITPADIIGPTPQGIEAGSFDELVRAMKAGATYVNVHSPRWPAGEIRGQIRSKHGDDDHGDHGKKK